MKSHEPYVPSHESPREFSFKALFLGVVLGLFFSIANTYLGLKVGMTISASIPTAVISMATFRLLRMRASILENNIVQTVGAVGEGLAAGIIFTVPAIFILGGSVSNFKIFLFAVLGGILGILFMIPMRRYIIVKEHGVLPFPEGSACAEILKAGESSGKSAITTLWGFLMGAVYKVASGIFFLWDEVFVLNFKQLLVTQFRLDSAASLLGVGFIIGPRISALMLSGGIMAWWVLIPLIKMYGSGYQTIFPSEIPLNEMDPLSIWSNYIRYIGAGTVAVGGLYSLFQLLPLLGRTMKIGFQELFQKGGDGAKRTDRDISMKWLLLGSFAIILLLWLLPGLNMNLFTIVLLVILGYFFVAVTSLTVGLVGTSSNPASGMVITTLLITGGLFSLFGWVDPPYLIMAITMSCVISVTIALAATTSQDLKTGFLLGATPKFQQIAEMIGLLLPAIAIGGILMLLNSVYGFGSVHLPAPQATLMAIIAKGVIAKELPVALVVIGGILAFLLILTGLSVLPFAIGLYLPFELSSGVMVGGIIRALVHKWEKRSDVEGGGILTASGMIAGEACVGVLIAFLTAGGLLSSDSAPFFPPFCILIFYSLLSCLLLWRSLASR